MNCLKKLKSCNDDLTKLKGAIFQKTKELFQNESIEELRQISLDRFYITELPSIKKDIFERDLSIEEIKELINKKIKEIKEHV
jgi:hypothetical protein